MKRLTSNVLAILLLLSLVGCGSSSSRVGYAENDSYGGGYSTQTNGIAGLAGSSNKSESAVSDQFMPSEEAPSQDQSVDTEPSQSQGGAVIQKDMLVYRGNVSLTTKDYDTAIKGVFDLFSTYDCFIEYSREYTDYRYYDDTDLMVYEATIRVNSASYDEFMNNVGSLGVVVSKSSNVTNMNMEYSDTVTALRIQNARLERYLARLEQETDSQVALQLEREITDIQIELQQLEARKSLIETDVAYSYVELKIKEVQPYSSQVSHEDPFHVRLWAEVVNTYYEFTEFLTNLIFFIVHASPYIVIVIPVGIITVKKLKGKIKFKKRPKKVKSDEEDKK